MSDHGDVAWRCRWGEGAGGGGQGRGGSDKSKRKEGYMPGMEGKSRRERERGGKREAMERLEMGLYIYVDRERQSQGDRVGERYFTKDSQLKLH